ncbi:MAG: hypothetical protein ABI562_06490, partial [Chloroflexota bacterium]
FTLRVLPVGELVVTSDPSVVETLFGDPVTFAAGEANDHHRRARSGRHHDGSTGSSHPKGAHDPIVDGAGAPVARGFHRGTRRLTRLSRSPAR